MIGEGQRGEEAEGRDWGRTEGRGGRREGLGKDRGERRQKGVIGEGQRGEEAEGSDWGRTEGREGMEIRSILPTKIL